jgi:2-hydroxy-6-oxonona-2,4-dienedioate hydrolase
MISQGFSEKWMDVAGVKTRYFDAGERGPPIVLIHGGRMGEASGLENAQDWERNFRELAGTRRVIAFDRLGQGWTDNPAHEVDCTMAGSVRHATAFLKRLGAGPYNLVGHSSGGYVAGAIALADPGLVSACAIVDSACAAPGEGRNSIVLASNPETPGTAAFSRFVYERMSCDPSHVVEEWISAKQEAAMLPERLKLSELMSTRLLAAQFMPSFVGDRDRFFMQIDADGFRRPVLLVWGYNDPIAPLQMGLDLFDKIAKLQARTSLHVINQAGHFSFRERPEEFNRAITGFFEGASHGE